MTTASEINWDCDCCWQTVSQNKPRRLHDVYGNKTYLQAYHLTVIRNFKTFSDIHQTEFGMEAIVIDDE